MGRQGTFVDDSNSVRYDNTREVESEGVATRSLAYLRSKARWDLTDALASTDKMRDEGPRWLPAFPGEKVHEYRDRLKRSHLLGAYSDAVEKLVSKPFSREISFSNADDLPEFLSRMHEDPARDGTAQTPFWRDVFHEAIDRGVTFVLVDYQQTGGEQSAGQEQNQALHPYLVHVRPPQLLGVDRRMRASDGKHERERVRVHFVKTEKHGEYGEREVEYINQYDAPPDVSGDDEDFQLLAADAGLLIGTFTQFRKNPDADAKSDEEQWEVSVETTEYSFPDEIPLRVLVFHGVGEDEGRPCLWQLAELNLEHWQKKSDRDNLLHIAHVPVLVRYGWANKELRRPLMFGGARSMGTTQKDARTEYVDARPAAAALAISKEDLEHIEEQMERAGLEPLVRRASSSLATNMAIGDAKEMNLLQAWALLLEAFILECYRTAGMWVNEEVPDEFAVDIFSEYGLSSRATESLDHLDRARQRGDISHETYLQELKRFSVLAEGIDVDEEIERTTQESKDKAAAFGLDPAAGAAAGQFGQGGPEDETEQDGEEPEAQEEGNAPPVAGSRAAG